MERANKVNIQAFLIQRRLIHMLMVQRFSEKAFSLNQGRDWVIPVGDTFDNSIIQTLCAERNEAG